jgi:hypothetical protein
VVWRQVEDWPRIEGTILQPENCHAEGTNHFTWDRQAERTNTILAAVGHVDNLQQILLFNKISLLAFRVAIGGAADRGAGALKVKTYFYRCTFSII